MDSTSQYLSGFDIRPSFQRIAIMRYLIQNKTHPTADEIFETLREQIPTLSKTTVYNTLKLFVKHGAAIYIGIDPKYARFDGDTRLHAHFRCRKCGGIFDLDMDRDIKTLLPRDFHGRIEDMYFYLKGICEGCSKQKN